MKLTETLDMDIASYEQKYGKTVTPALRELLASMAAVGDYFYDLGVNDAATGQIPLAKASFVEWTKRDLGDRYDENDDSISTLMHMCYTDGYNNQREAAE